jgi:hypothetical protein
MRAIAASPRTCASMPARSVAPGGVHSAAPPIPSVVYVSP